MLTSGDDLERQKCALKELFRSYNNADKKTVRTQVDLLATRLTWATGLCEDQEIELVEDEEEEVRRLARQEAVTKQKKCDNCRYLYSR